MSIFFIIRLVARH